ncbi:hypothetical protein BH18ACT2_BH18ACT2_03330 [soil metagenome]
MTLNLGWTTVFLGLESPAGGLVAIAALVAVIVVDVRESWRVHTVAGVLLVPYLLWCCFAAALNIGVFALN